MVGYSFIPIILVMVLKTNKIQELKIQERWKHLVLTDVSANKPTSLQDWKWSTLDQSSACQRLFWDKWIPWLFLDAEVAMSNSRPVWFDDGASVGYVRIAWRLLYLFLDDAVHVAFLIYVVKFVGWYLLVIAQISCSDISHEIMTR